VAAFDGERAFALLQAQCAFGPRPPGTAAHEKTAQFLMAQMKPLVDEFTGQKWNETVTSGPGSGRSYAMTNILGMLRGRSDGAGRTTPPGPPALLICAHWDTRPVADEESDAARQRQPIIGANDGASGVAAVLGLARALHAARPQQTVAFALWDAEDLGVFSYGARHFATAVGTRAWRRWRPREAILLDMIADRDLNFTREISSMKLAPNLWARLQNAASETGLSQYFTGAAVDITDDHTPLNAGGIATIDLIDFDYRYWHTLGDTPDKCSAQSLQITGDVLLRFIADNGQGTV
jgi:Zn-dependent M28 family amino/carboxypeptidase